MALQHTDPGGPLKALRDSSHGRGSCASATVQRRGSCASATVHGRGSILCLCGSSRGEGPAKKINLSHHACAHRNGTYTSQGYKCIQVKATNIEYANRASSIPEGLCFEVYGPDQIVFRNVGSRSYLHSDSANTHVWIH